MSHVRMPGSCGEFVQGIIDGVDLHITCPIDRYSKVYASRIGGGGLLTPPGLDKTEQAVRRALKSIGSEAGIELSVRSELPQGKGMASSTADIAAAIVATYNLHNRDISPEDISKMALSIEPTDGTLFNGIVAFDHREGRKLEPIGQAPPIEIIVLEPPEVIDTIAFNKEKGKIGKADEVLIRESFDMATEGVRTGNIRLIGEAATLSAVCNQKILPKIALTDIINVGRQKGGIGVNIAHSGTIIGMMVEKGFGRRFFDRIAHYVPRPWKAYCVSVVDGGVRHEEVEPAAVN